MLNSLRGALSQWRRRRHERRHPTPHRDRSRHRSDRTEFDAHYPGSEPVEHLHLTSLSGAGIPNMENPGARLDIPRP